jgi:hypothetical protein
MPSCRNWWAQAQPGFPVELQTKPQPVRFLPVDDELTLKDKSYGGSAVPAFIWEAGDPIFLAFLCDS